MTNIDISGRTYLEMLGALAGLYLAVLGNGKRAQHNGLLKRGIRVEGEVIDLKKTHWTGFSYARRPNYYPVIHFETVDSGPVSGYYELVSSNPPLYKLGEKVQVCYDPDDHRKFVLDNTSTKLFGYVVLLIGIAIFLAAIIFYILDPDSYIRF